MNKGEAGEGIYKKLSKKPEYYSFLKFILL